MSHLSEAQRLFKSLGADTDWEMQIRQLGAEMRMGNLRFRDVDPDGIGARADFLVRNDHNMSGTDYIRALLDFEFPLSRIRKLFLLKPT